MWRSCHRGLRKSGSSSHRRLTAVGIAVCCAVAAAPAARADATAHLTVHAQVLGRTSLNVSTENLRFDVSSPNGSATASVDFSAAARTHADGDVMLSIELLRPGGDADEPYEPAAALTFAGEGEGTGAGDVTASGSHVAARWVGSGHRTGRLLFTLRTRAAGSYAVPVRFVLTAP